MMLYEVDIRRSREMFSHWFSDMTVLHIWNSIYNKGVLDERFRRNDQIKRSAGKN